MVELYISDVQFPYQDQEALDIVTQVAKDIHPDVLFLGGDIVDFYQLSKFSQDPRRKLELQKDIDIAYDGVEGLINAAGVKRTIWQEGNHEWRLKGHLWSKDPALAGLRALTIEKLFDFKAHGIEWYGRDQGAPLYIGELGHIHGDELCRGGKHPAEKTMLRAPGNYLFGHHHVIDVSYYRLQNGTTYVSQANGCLCSLTPEYVLMPQWQQSFTVVKYTMSGTFNMNVVPFFRRHGTLQCVLDGKTYLRVKPESKQGGKK